MHFFNRSSTGRHEFPPEFENKLAATELRALVTRSNIVYLKKFLHYCYGREVRMEGEYRDRKHVKIYNMNNIDVWKSSDFLLQTFPCL